MTARIHEIYRRLQHHFGPQHWWPGETKLEITVGALLTQNTNWRNVEKAMANLRDHQLLSLPALTAIPTDLLAHHLIPAGYYNLKAHRLKNLIAAIGPEDDDLEIFLAADLDQLREKLLAVKGIGPETADAIILYAAEKPSFVIDAYTHRVLLRHDLIGEETDYYEMQDLFLAALPADVVLYNEYHALLVRLGKEFCLKNKPRCGACPLAGL
jgi:endonuclease-3 related protein